MDQQMTMFKSAVASGSVICVDRTLLIYVPVI
jgi:hypothetical protein